MKYKEQILKLRVEGKTYDEIIKIVGCAKSTVCYYCGENQKEKTINRSIKSRWKKRFANKIDNFKQKTKEKNIIKPYNTWQHNLYNKLFRYLTRGQKKKNA